jgi:ABC-type glycerol-3-phosphate transport system permease component
MRLIIRIIENDFTPYILVTMIISVMLLPIVLIAANSFKSEAEVFAWPPTIIPREFTLDSYGRVMNSPVPINMRNSAIIAGGTTLLVIGTSTLTAYGLSKYKFRGSNLLLLLIFGTRIVPPVSLLLPFYILFGWLGLINSFEGLILLNTYLCYPLMVWVLKGFFDDFPRELIECAIIDGCSRLGAFLRIVIPVSAVGITAASIITFLWTWNEFLYALMFTNTIDIAPLTLGIFYFVGDEVIEWGSLSAVAMFTSLPALFFFAFAQKYIVKGLTKGALKF